MKKEKTKARTSVQVEQQFIGDEPSWGEKTIGLVRSLSWYSNQCSPKDSKKFTIDYAKQNKYNSKIIEKLSEVSDEYFLNLGFVCRIIQRGANIDKKQWIDQRINSLLEKAENPQEISQFAKKEEKVTVQDRIKDQSSVFISEIDGYIDQWIKTKKQVDFNPYDWMNVNAVKAPQAKCIMEYYSGFVDELKQAYNKTDNDLVEGYSNFKRTELKGFITFIDMIISDCEKIINNSKISKKPRKKKAIPLAKKVSKIKYKKEDLEYKLVSISPVDIIGCKYLMVFNTKTKKLGIYYSKDDSGLSVKGSSIEDYDEIISGQKTLRKPTETLELALKCKKTEIKKVLTGINGKQFQLNGRINSDTILLKVVK